MKPSISRTWVNGKKNLKNIRGEFERKRNWHINPNFVGSFVLETI